VKIPWADVTPGQTVLGDDGERRWLVERVDPVVDEVIGVTLRPLDRDDLIMQGMTFPSREVVVVEET
jgi:hypothetical protein